MGWWAWFLLGAASGVAAYLLVANAFQWTRESRRPRPPAPSSYFATPGARRVVNFKGEDEAGDDEIGPVFITDADDPDFVHDFGWMKISDARELAEGLGHPLNTD